MASEPIRDPANDHLLTPKNSAFIVIDYQPVQVNSIASMDRQLLINNIVGTSRAAITYGLPIVHSTVNVKSGLNKPPIRTCAKCWTSFLPMTEPRSTRGRMWSFEKRSKRPAGGS